MSILQKLKIDIDRNIAATDSFIETRVYEVYEDLKKKDRITEKYTRTWFDPLEKEFYDDITFKSRSTPLTLKGLYQVPGNTRGMQPILIFYRAHSDGNFEKNSCFRRHKNWWKSCILSRVEDPSNS